MYVALNIVTVSSHTKDYYFSLLIFHTFINFVE
jgi:hypothetical protein